MTDKQMEKVRSKAYKYYDEVIYEHQDWSKPDIALSSFYAGAEYALANKYDELKKGNTEPNIVKFLKENGVYEMFFTNLFNQKQGECLSQYFLFHFFNSSAIFAAFTWCETHEGHTFWQEISDRWNEQF